MLVFDCHICHGKLSADEAQAGKMVRCSHCMTALKVPAPAMAATAPAAERVPGSSIVARPFSGNTATMTKPRIGAKRYGFNCVYCSSRLEATDAMAGNEGQCPTCGSTITIPIQDRYGRLIDPKTQEIIKPDPHPVHAYAAAGERAPVILRKEDGKQYIRCGRCSANSPITANNCKACGMPFTMEGTTVQAAGTSNGFCVASLVLGIIGIPTFCAVIPALLALIFGVVGFIQTGKTDNDKSGRGMAIAGMICGAIGLLLAFYKWIV